MVTVDEIRAAVDTVFNQYFDPEDYSQERQAAADEFHRMFPDRDASVFERWLEQYYGDNSAANRYIAQCEVRRLKTEREKLQAALNAADELINTVHIADSQERRLLKVYTEALAALDTQEAG